MYKLYNKIKCYEFGYYFLLMVFGTPIIIVLIIGLLFLKRILVIIGLALLGILYLVSEKILLRKYKKAIDETYKSNKEIEKK